GLGSHPALGLACGSVSLMGGFSTSIAFTKDFETLGFSEAAATGVAAATFGMVMSNVVAAPLTTLLIRRKHLAAEREPTHETERAPVRIVGILDELRALA